MEIELGIWLAVCDGQKALLFENVGARGELELITRDTFAQHNPPTHLQGSARPGKVFSGRNGRHSATEETDFHEQRAIAFLGRFAWHINQAVEKRRIESLIVVAPPKALGILRSQLSHQARDKVTVELDKDLVKLPVAEIEHHLTLAHSPRA